MRKGRFIRAGKKPDENKALTRNSHFGFAELLWGANSDVIGRTGICLDGRT